MQLPSYVTEGIRRLEGSGFEVYVVGGAVRDALMGKAPSDYDLCTNARPEEIIRVFAEFTLVKRGAKYGTVRVVMGAHLLDVSTYRCDGAYSDRRRPDTVCFCDSLREDLSRRDFTINAIAYHPTTSFVDYFGGQADLQSKIVRCVGDPAERFSQDALRILRALRFAARMRFTLESHTELAAYSLRSLLKGLSAERIRDELSGFIVCRNAGGLLQRYREIIFEFLPELKACDGFAQHNPNHNYDVLGHIAETLNHSAEDLTLRLAALLHDVGKPRCFTLENGRGHFFGHMEVSAQMAKVILERLRYPSKMVDAVSLLIENHDKAYNASPQSARSWLNKMGSKNLFLLMMLKRADILAHDPSYHNRLKLLSGFKRSVVEVLRRGDVYSLSRLAVNGGDINRELGLSPGDKTGEVLRYLLQCVIDGSAENTPKDLLLLAQEYQQSKGIETHGHH